MPKPAPEPQWPFFELFGHPISQTKAIHAEIEGQTYRCPFLDQRCQKRSHADPALPTGVCSLVKSGRAIITCPNRFYENNLNLLHTVASKIWPQLQGSTLLVPNIKLKNAGNVDWFIIDKNPKTISDFIGAEVQAVDMTGSVQPALERFRKKLEPTGVDKFGINYKNVSKRMLTQLLEKGRCFKSWGKKMAVIVQDNLFKDLKERLGLKSIPLEAADIAFFVWSYNTASDKKYNLELSQIFGMSHESLLTHIMYSDLPSLDEITSKLQNRIKELGY
jgi:hypothetical protein